jgi:hypothetical protein
LYVAVCTAAEPGRARNAFPTVMACAAISGNHGHALEIPEADLNSIVDRTYSIQGLSGHDHTVTFSPAQLQSLKTGQAVTVASSVDQHGHNVTVTCA